MTLSTICARSLVALVVAFVVNAYAASSAEVDWHDRDSYSGWVTDAATGEPLEGAVVVATWQILRGYQLFGSEGRRERENVRLEETLTDKNGYFEFAPLGDYTPPPGWVRDEIASPLIRFFKPGYAPSGRTRFTWEFGEHSDSTRTSPLGPPKKDQWKREIRIYRHLTRPARTLVIDPSVMRTTEQEILEPLVGFASVLDWNVSVAEGSAEGAHQAIKTQWRAILMIDDEIRKYRPGYEWPINTALRNALRAAREREKTR